MAGNVVEILVKGTNATGPAFAEAKAGAQDAAAGADDLAAAQDRQAVAVGRAQKAQADFALAQRDQAQAAARLAELQRDDSASTSELTEAQNALTDSSLRAAAARRELATVTKTASDEQAAAGVKTAESGGLMAGMGGKVKMAMLGVAVGMGLAVKGAADFQQQTVRLVTSAGESAKNLGAVQQGILGLSSTTNTSTEQLASGMYQIESAGFHGANGLNVLKAAAEGAQAEGADLGEVANAVTSGLNAYGMKAKDATSFTNQMVQTVARGKMTMQDLAGSLSAVLPIAAASHISYAQVGGALATMTSMGVSARQGTQDLASTIRSLANPTSVATNEMAQFGISSTDVASKLGKQGLSGTIQQLSDAVTSKMGASGLVIVNAMNQSKAAAADAQEMLGKLPASIQGIAKSYLDGNATYKQFNTALKGSGLQAHELGAQFATVAGKAHGFNQLLASGSPAAQTYAAAMSKMLGGATGLSVGLMLTGSHAKTFADNVSAISGAAQHAGSDVKGWSDIQAETNFQLGSAEKAVKAMGISLGMALLPAVNAVLHPITELLGSIARNKTEATAFAIVIGGALAGALGVKMAGALKSMAEGIKSVGAGAEWLIGKLTGATAATEAQTAATEAGAAAQTEADVAMDANPIGAIIIAVVALIAVIVEVVKHWHDVAHAFDVVRHDIAAVADHVVHDVAGAFDAVRHAIATAVDAVISFIKAHWPLIVGIFLGPIAFIVAEVIKHWSQISALTAKLWHDVTGFIRRMWSDVTGDVSRGISDVLNFVKRLFDDWLGIEKGGLDYVVSFFEALPGRILHAVGDLGHLLWNAGKAVVEGLIGGIKNMWNDAVGTVENLGSSLLHGAMSVLGIGSPSKEFAKLGQYITQGLGLGIRETMGTATAAAQSLGQQVAQALNAGEITSTEAQSLTDKISNDLASRAEKVAQAATKIGLAFNRSLMISLEDPATASAAKSAVGKLASLVQQAWSSGLISNGQDTSISNWLAGQSQKLQALAGQRAQIEKTIAAAKQFAATTASNVAGAYTITGFATSGANGGPATVGQVISGLKLDVGNIRRFAANIKKLAKEGLNKTYLQQLIAAGPDQGGAMAAELAAAGLGDIKAINAEESAISKTSGALGKQAANEMYDTGKNAGQGFLSGLRGTLKSLNEMIKQMAKSMVETLKKELGISSPSTVLRYHGQMAGEGFALGVEDRLQRVAQSSQRLARAAVPGQGGYGAYAGGGGGRTELDVIARWEKSGDPLIDEIIKQVRLYVRIRGGSAQKVLGQGAG